MTPESLPFEITPQITELVIDDLVQCDKSEYIQRKMRKAKDRHPALHSYFQQNILTYPQFSGSYELGAALAYDLSTRQIEEVNSLVEFTADTIQDQKERSKIIFDSQEGSDASWLEERLWNSENFNGDSEFVMTINILESRAPVALDNLRHMVRSFVHPQAKIMSLRGFIDGFIPFYANRMYRIEQSEKIEKKVEKNEKDDQGINSDKDWNGL